MSARRALAVVLVLAAPAMTAASCRRAAPAPTPEPPVNAIVVVVDTLRADHLSAYGYPRATSPEFDRLAAESALFERAYSQAACTFPSVNSLLTSRAAPLFWGQPGRRMGIPAGVPTLAEVFAARGFSTVAVSASPVVRKSPTRFNPEGGFDRGFDVFDERCLWQDARCVASRALELLGAVDGPFFAYLHFMDPHGPYRPPPEHRQRFAAPYAGKDFIAAGDPNPIARGLLPGSTPVVLDAADRDHLLALYDEEISWWDERFGELVRALDERGLLERTILVVAADHGEAFLEHGQVKHCHTVFDEEIRTPLLVRLPGPASGRALRIAEPVENLDIAPTLLAALGLAPESAFAGRNLLPLLGAESEAPPAVPGRPATSAQGSLRAAVDGRFKLILDLESGAASLYDLSADAAERSDVARERPEDFRRLRRLLADHLAATEGAPERSIAAGREAAERLRSLGYLQ